MSKGSLRPLCVEEHASYLLVRDRRPPEKGTLHYKVTLKANCACSVLAWPRPLPAPRTAGIAVVVDDPSGRRPALQGAGISPSVVYK